MSDFSLTKMTPNYVFPTSNDVLCGTGNGVIRHPGNQTFLDLVKEKYMAYFQAKQKEKKEIADWIAKEIFTKDGRFLKQHEGCWFEINYDDVLRKISQALRDQMTQNSNARRGITYTRDCLGGALLSGDLCGSTKSEIDLDLCNVKAMFSSTLPNEMDVLSGSGNGVMRHPGNQKFRAMVKETYLAYCEGPKEAKREIRKWIVKGIWKTGGRFLKQDCVGNWYELNHAETLQKISQALRDQVRDQMNQHIKIKEEDMGPTNAIEPITNDQVVSNDHLQVNSLPLQMPFVQKHIREYDESDIITLTSEFHSFTMSGIMVSESTLPDMSSTLLL